jgi:hypothetical protein
MSNYATPPQLVENAPYRDMGEMQGYARTWRDRHRGQRFEGLVLDPQDAELWFRTGVVHRHRGEPAEAEKVWRRILGLKRPNQFCSVDQGIYGHLTRRNLAALAAERGDHAETERLWREVLAECPGDREATAKLGGAFVREYVGAGGETTDGAGTEQDQD